MPKMKRKAEEALAADQKTSKKLKICNVFPFPSLSDTAGYNVPSK
jgi:hypothetical protein